MISSITRARRWAVLGATLLALLVAAQPVSAAATRFGANLYAGVFPSNAYPGQWCDHQIDGGSGTYTCTWILNQAFNTSVPTASAKAPKDGNIVKVRIVNGQGGSFTLFIARKNASGQFKVVAKGPKITYATDPCNPGCVIHKFSISPLAVKKGDYLAIKTAKTSMLRCDSGGTRIALFATPLVVGGGYTTPTDYSGCWMLLQAVYAS